MFDSYIGIDWSGAKSPLKSNAIAMASCDNIIDSKPCFDSKKKSRSDVFAVLRDYANDKKRTLAGIDCNFGYCIDVGHKQFGKNAHFNTLWQTVDALNHGHDNFFAGEFWTHPEYGRAFWTQGKQPEWFDLHALRRQTEIKAHLQGLGTPESPFKLIGAKQVGKGGLAGMRMIAELKREFPKKVCVWPFDIDHFHSASLVITEIYPRLFIRHAGFGNEKVRTEAQLNTILQHFGVDCRQTYSSDASDSGISDHLSDAIIASAGLRWFCQNERVLDINKLPEQALRFEGWIFGVKP
uniref:hypothetical protein n=1 Tax=Ningiella ruwaisensis TaxID=2364274 RepID=UPI00109FBA6B|nr:hypothetical protein [Ningiella ruwaisensis]